MGAKLFMNNHHSPPALCQVVCVCGGSQPAPESALNLKLGKPRQVIHPDTKVLRNLSVTVARDAAEASGGVSSLRVFATAHQVHHRAVQLPVLGLERVD